MKSFSEKSEEKKKNKTHDPGAFMAWGLIAGALLGAVVGQMFGRPFLGAFVLGTIGGTVGALMDRSRL